MKNYKELYLLYCKDLNRGWTKEGVKKHNAAMKKLGDLFRELKSVKERDFLLEMLETEDEYTQSLVASHCLGLGVYIKESKRVLNKISKSSKDPFCSFSAKATLDVYKEQGYLDF